MLTSLLAIAAGLFCAWLCKGPNPLDDDNYGM